MKNNLIILLLLLYLSANSQNVGIGTPSPKSKLHVAGDVRIDSLAKKVRGVVVHNESGVLGSLKLTGKKTDVLRGDGTFESLNAVSADSPNWLTTGNSGIDPDNNFIGTTDDAPLKFRVNNMKAGEIDQRPNNNTSFGKSSGGEFDSSHGNTAIGANALEINSKGNANTAIGWGSLPNNTHGRSNTAIGALSLGSNVSGNFNCAFGVDALIGNTTGYENCAMGYFTMRGSGKLPGAPPGGHQNTAMGTRAMQDNDYGYRNTAVGADALRSNWSGGRNTAIGTGSLFNNKVDNQTAIGYQSLYWNTNGQNNTSTGYQALYYNFNGNFNTSTGFKSLHFNLSGSGNVANGTEALYGNTSGSSNVAIGFRSLLANTTGVSNTATGTRALVSNTTGVNNTGYGYGALLTNVTGFQNTAVGMLADVTTGNLQNATAIGYGAKVNASNKVRIGNASVKVIEGQVPFSTPSDGRFKFNVKEDVPGLEFIMQLRPVTYQYDMNHFHQQVNMGVQVSENNIDNTAIKLRRTGFIAQEVEIAANIIGFDFNGINKPSTPEDYYSLSYESFVAPLVKAIHEQQQQISSLQNRVLTLEQKLAKCKSNN